MLYPTISLPVAIVLFDLGRPGEYLEESHQPVPEKPIDTEPVHHVEMPGKEEQPSIPPKLPVIRRRPRSRGRVEPSASV